MQEVRTFLPWAFEPPAVTEGADVEEVAAVLDDEASRCILLHAHSHHMAVSELAECCDVSEPTIYRRLERLQDLELVAERTVPDRDGHHYAEYRTTLDRLTVDLTEEGFVVEVSRIERAADRFTRLIEEM